MLGDTKFLSLTKKGKYKLSSIFVTIFCLCSTNLFGQIDAVKIASAKKAFENQEYQLAIDAVNEASAAAQKNKMCLYYKGYSFYKLEQYDSAAVFLKKYLLLDVTKKDVMEALVDIDYQNRKVEALDAEVKKILGDAVDDSDARIRLSKYENLIKTDGDYEFSSSGVKERGFFSPGVLMFSDYLSYADITSVYLNEDGSITINTSEKKVINKWFEDYKLKTTEYSDFLKIDQNTKNNEIFKLLDSICRHNKVGKLYLKYLEDKKH